MKARSTILVIVFSFLYDVDAIKKITNPTVTLPGLGAVEGTYGKTAWTKIKYSKFLDLPYAQSSLQTRFQAPLPLEPFDETYNAYTNDIPCPSLNNIDDIMSYGEMYDYEDCLHLTVSSTNKSSSQPVMVYLAGYDLMDSENEDAEPDYLLEKNVVLVTVQYRGGPLGFLSTLTKGIPGNIGVLDVIEALRWIRNYIKFFGGDPDNVTIFGQYGNAALINVLTMSPLLEKETLFHRVIYQSGSALLDNMVSANPVIFAKELGKQLECKTLDDIEELNRCLKAADLGALLHAFSDVQNLFGKMPFFTIGGPSGVLSDSPKKLLEEGNFRSYPTMGGVVRHPSMGTSQLDNIESKYNSIAMDMAMLIKDKLKSEHEGALFSMNLPLRLFKKTVFRAIWPGLVDISSMEIKESTSRVLKYNAKKEKSYLFAFNYRGQYNKLVKSEEDDFYDVSLTDDNIYLFPFRPPLSKKDKAVAQLMVDLFTSFALNGEPDSQHLITPWPSMLKDTLGPYLIIDEVPEIAWHYANEFFTTVLETRNDLTLL